MSRGYGLATERVPGVLRSIPLVISYVIFPLTELLFRSFGELSRAWLEVAWLLLACTALAISIARADRPLLLPHIPKLCWIAFPIFLVAFLRPLAIGEIAATPYLMECKPWAYLLVALLWTNAFGLPSRRAHVRVGLILTTIIVAELVITSLHAHALVHPQGSGETNYDALLLILSLCASLSDPGARLTNTLPLFLGVTSTMSRTGAITAMVVLLFSHRLSNLTKLLAVGAGVGAAALSFLTRGLGADPTQIDRFLMWSSAFDLFYALPSKLLFGFGPGSELPVSIPTGLLDLWELQSANISLSGVFAFHFHSMWLRSIISFGALATVLSGLVLAMWTVQSRYTLARSLAITIFLEGFTMGVFYLSNIAVPLFLLLFTATAEFSKSGVTLSQGGYRPQLLPQEK
jgi:hypothetical protein